MAEELFKGGKTACIPDHSYCTVHGVGRGSSVAVKSNGVDCSGDGSTAVASPLLLCLLVTERPAFREPEHVVRFLAPVAVSSELGIERVVC